MKLLEPKDNKKIQEEMDSMDPVKLLDISSHHGYLNGIQIAISKLQEKWNENYSFNWKADYTLEVAAEKGFLNIIKYILEDSSAHFNTSSYRQAAYKAISNSNNEIYKLLEEKAKDKTGKNITKSNPKNINT